MRSSNGFSSPSAAPCRRRARRGHRMALGAVALAAAVAAAGCRSTATDPGSLLAIAGTFHLVQVNGAPLPYLNGSTYIVRGTFVIQSSPRYTFTETDSAAGAATNFTSAGQWTITNNTLTMFDDNGELYVATLSQGADTARVQIGTHLDIFVK